MYTNRILTENATLHQRLGETKTLTEKIISNTEQIKQQYVKELTDKTTELMRVYVEVTVRAFIHDMLTRPQLQAYEDSNRKKDAIIGEQLTMVG